MIQTTATPDRRVKLRRSLHSEILADDKVERGNQKQRYFLQQSGIPSLSHNLLTGLSRTELVVNDGQSQVASSIPH